MATYVIKKETKGFSIIKDGLKVSYGGGITFRMWPSTAVFARLDMYQFLNSPISSYIFDVDNDIITINTVLFASTATALCNSLRDTVLYD